MALTRMNGQRLRFRTVADFRRADRRSEVGRHVTVERARRVIFELTRSSTRGTYGNLWITDLYGRVLEGPYREGGERPSLESRRGGRIRSRP